MEWEIRTTGMVRGSIMITAKLNQYFIDTIPPHYTHSCLFSSLSAAFDRDTCHWVWVFRLLACFILNRFSHAGFKSILRNDTPENTFVRKGLFQAGLICRLVIIRKTN